MCFCQRKDYSYYYQGINKAEACLLTHNYKLADSIYKNLLSLEYNFFYKDLQNALIVSEKTGSESNIIRLKLKKHIPSEEISRVYLSDQYNRKFVGKLLLSKKKRIERDERNFVKIKSLLLDENFTFYNDDIKKASIVVTHNVDKEAFDSEFLERLLEMVKDGRMHPILYSNIYERYSILHYKKRFYNNTAVYISDDKHIVLKDNAPFLSAGIDEKTINERRRIIYLAPLDEARKMFSVYFNLNLSYYLYL